jgi:hypothetical protein
LLGLRFRNGSILRPQVIGLRVTRLHNTNLRHRQHFERYHPIYVPCPRCGKSFEGDGKQADLNQHLVQTQICDVETNFQRRIDGITLNDWDEIKQRKPANKDEEQYWMFIYELLFQAKPYSGHACMSASVMLGLWHSTDTIVDPEDYAALAFQLYQEGFTRDITTVVNNDIISFVMQSRYTEATSDIVMHELLSSLPHIVEPGIKTSLADGFRGRKTVRARYASPTTTNSLSKSPEVVDGMAWGELLEESTTHVDGTDPHATLLDRPILNLAADAVHRDTVEGTIEHSPLFPGPGYTGGLANDGGPDEALFSDLFGSPY